MSTYDDESFQEFLVWVRHRRSGRSGYTRPDDRELISKRALETKLKELGFDAPALGEAHATGCGWSARCC